MPTPVRPVRYPWTTWRTSDEQYYTEMTTTMKTSQKNTRASTSISSAQYSKAWHGLARHGSSQSPEQQRPHNHDHRFQTCRNQNQQRRRQHHSSQHTGTLTRHLLKVLQQPLFHTHPTIQLQQAIGSKKDVTGSASMFSPEPTCIHHSKCQTVQTH